jgi:opacity protein-like surface antigen
MRKLLAGAVCALALAAPGAGVAQNQPGWSYAYTEGVATATQRDDRGRVTATFTCRPPTGDIVVTDYTLGPRARRATTAGVTLGNLTVNVPAAVEGRGRQARVVINLPQRPPILASAQERDVVTVTVNNQTHTYQPGSAMRLKEVAYGCWGS